MPNINTVASVYSAIQSREIENTAASMKHTNASQNFQNIVQNFDQMASMSSINKVTYLRNAIRNNAQMDNRIAGGVQTNFANYEQSGAVSVASSLIKHARKELNNHESTIKKSIIGKASALDIAITSHNATMLVSTMTKVRDKFLEGWNQILNMNL